MKRTMFDIGKVMLVGALLFSLAGCSVAFYRRYPRDKEKIEELSAQIQELERRRSEEKSEFEKALAELQRQLKSEISRDEVRLGMDERGLVITVTDKILFDSGKADVKKEAYDILGKVAGILRKKLSDKNIGVEGHTDSQPIKHSKWKSNWELSTARATSVVHHLIEQGKITPQRLQATGYGEYRPISGNLDPEGMQKNRRVEIIIPPNFTRADIDSLEQKKRDYDRSLSEAPERRLK